MLDFNIIPSDNTAGKLLSMCAFSAGIAYWMSRSISHFNPTQAAIFCATYMIAKKISREVLHLLKSKIDLSQDYLPGRLLEKAIALGAPLLVLTHFNTPHVTTAAIASLNFGIYFLACQIYKVLQNEPAVIRKWSK